MQRTMKMRTAAFLAAALPPTLGAIATAGGAELPVTPHQHHRAVPARRTGRHPGAHPARQDARGARPDDHHRERRRRRRQHRRRPRRRARRPTATRSASGNWTSHVGGAAIYPVQYDIAEGSRAGRAARRSRRPSIVARQSMPANDLKELIAWLKANPDKATAATVGAGSPAHVSGIYFQNADRHALPVRALSRRRPGDAGPGRRPGRPADRRRGVADAAARARRHGQGLRRHGQDAAGRRRPTSRPSTRRACPASTSRSGTGSGRPRARRRTSSRKLNAAMVEALADPSVRKRLADIGIGNSAARAADAGGARRLPQGRDRQVVADHQGGEHQGRIG